MISSKRKRLALAPLAALCLSGCVATQQDILDLSSQTDALTAQTLGLKKTLGTLQANQAELAVKLDQLHADVTTLTENLKDNQEGMSRLGVKMDDLGAALGSKVSSLDESLTAQKKMLEAQEESRQKLAAEAEAARKKAEEAAKSSKAAEASGPTPSELYNSARAQLGRKEYAMAEQGFTVYLQKYPKGELADNATYSLGQTLYEQKKWEDAARQYAAVLDRYPKSELTPSARLRYAVCLMNLKIHLDEAKRYLESIPEDFPRSPEAGKAKEILKSWEKKASSDAESSGPAR